MFHCDLALNQLIQLFTRDCKSCFHLDRFWVCSFDSELIHTYVLFHNEDFRWEKLFLNQVGNVCHSRTVCCHDKNKRLGLHSHNPANNTSEFQGLVFTGKLIKLWNQFFFRTPIYWGYRNATFQKQWQKNPQNASSPNATALSNLKIK